jgi:hypothetical protein
MTDEELEAKLSALDGTLNIVVPLITDCAERLDAVETAIALLIPGIEKVTNQQRGMIAELKAEIAVKDAELARLRGSVTLN